MIVVAIAALIGGRLYHVIDQWQLYKDDLSRIVLPPYSGLGVYGGIIAGVIAAYALRALETPAIPDLGGRGRPRPVHHAGRRSLGELLQPGAVRSADHLPWGIAIQCQYRTQGYPCPPGSDPLATLGQHFHPMFLYESLSGLVGAMVLIWIARRFADRLRPGDLLLVFFIWYGAVRFVVESLKADNWLFFGVPTAQIIATLTVLGATAILVIRHARSAATGPPGTELDRLASP